MELSRLRPRLAGVEDAVWVTFDSPQSRSLLADQRALFIPPVPPRGLAPAAATVVRATRILRARRVDAVISTGAAVALSFMLPARALGIPCHYIESAARIEGPSLTARLLRPLPGVRFYTQHPELASGVWDYVGSVFEGFARVERPGSTDALKVVVTLGSLQGFGFRRLLERVAPLLASGAEVVWQTGSTDASGLGLDATPYLSEAELRSAMAAADVVIAHAGVGTALMALETGHQPILVPREAAHSEHVDDHQVQIARALEARGLALHRAVDDLGAADLDAAASRGVVDVPVPAISLEAPH